jgi:hypothetical protein
MPTQDEDFAPDVRSSLLQGDSLLSEWAFAEEHPAGVVVPEAHHIAGIRLELDRLIEPVKLTPQKRRV